MSELNSEAFVMDQIACVLDGRLKDYLIYMKIE